MTAIDEGTLTKVQALRLKGLDQALSNCSTWLLAWQCSQGAGLCIGFHCEDSRYALVKPDPLKSRCSCDSGGDSGHHRLCLPRQSTGPHGRQVRAPAHCLLARTTLQFLMLNACTCSVPCINRLPWSEMFTSTTVVSSAMKNIQQQGHSRKWQCAHGMCKRASTFHCLLVLPASSILALWSYRSHTKQKASR